MKLSFTKMHGAGNDYIYVNCFDHPITLPKETIERLSHRHFGIGGDGVVLICPSTNADAKMVMYNNDGSEGKMCGNAIRCVAKYLYDHKICTKNPMTIDTLSGVKTLTLKIEKDKVTEATVNMGKAMLRPEDLPVLCSGDEMINYPMKVEGMETRLTFVSMGNPHAVAFVDDVLSLDLQRIGPMFENHPLFPERVNTEFIRVIDDKTLEMRVYERGSGETQACGTGACAAAVAAVLTGFAKKDTDITVKLLGGELIIRYTDEAVFMTGPCTEVFSGEITL